MYFLVTPAGYIRSLCFAAFFAIALILPKACESVISSPFRSQIVDSTVSIGYGIALGDVDGDGKTDILLADKKQFVWYRNGDWKKFVMAENLTEYDNVCITARDLDGDGKVEVAVGAQWNPSETSNEKASGSVHYLQRSADPMKLWSAIKLPHEPTVHRMKWIRDNKGDFWLVVLPLHGRGNKAGEGAGVRVLAYKFPQNVNSSWDTLLLDDQLHLTHNFDVVEKSGAHVPGLYFASKEGIQFRDLDFTPGKQSHKLQRSDNAAGEIQTGNSKSVFIATIEPMHGNQLVLYFKEDWKRIVLDSNLKEGHALGTGDFLKTGSDQVVTGWRQPNNEGKIGIKLFYRGKANSNEWQSFWIDENGMACEDLQVADLDSDGKLDIIASGRATRNLKIYWNRGN